MVRNLRVHIYYNLHKHLFSVKIGSKVVAHAESLLLKNATFKVGKKGWERVVKTGVRNVHAGVTGELVFNPQEFPKKMPSEKVSYNPFRSNQFLKENNQPINEASLVYFNNGKCFV